METIPQRHADQVLGQDIQGKGNGDTRFNQTSIYRAACCRHLHQLKCMGRYANHATGFLWSMSAPAGTQNGGPGLWKTLLLGLLGGLLVLTRPEGLSLVGLVGLALDAAYQRGAEASLDAADRLLDEALARLADGQVTAAHASSRTSSRMRAWKSPRACDSQASSSRSSFCSRRLPIAADTVSSSTDSSMAGVHRPGETVRCNRARATSSLAVAVARVSSWR